MNYKILSAVIISSALAMSAALYFSYRVTIVSVRDEWRHASSRYEGSVPMLFWLLCAPRYGERVVVDFDNVGMNCSTHEVRHGNLRSKKLVATHDQIRHWDSSGSYAAKSGTLGKPKVR